MTEARLPFAGPGLQPGARVGPFRVLRELARGGMGEVYLAEWADGQLEQQVALKLIRSGMDSVEVHRRFISERQILARLHHPRASSFAAIGSGSAREWRWASRS